MTAYVLFQSTTRDPAKLAAYAAGALPLVAAHGGRILAMGEVSVLHDSRAFERATLIAFPDRASARAWHDGTDYQALLRLRGEAMDCSVVMIG